MQYAEFQLTDLGFVDGDGNPLSSIEGRDNQAEPFRHLGYVGYPDGALMCIDAPDKRITLAVFPDGAALPVGGAEIDVEDVVGLLVSEYGWPEGTEQVDGLPVAPKNNMNGG